MVIFSSLDIILPEIKFTDSKVTNREIGIRFVKFKIQLKNPITNLLKDDLISPNCFFFAVYSNINAKKNDKIIIEKKITRIRFFNLFSRLDRLA